MKDNYFDVLIIGSGIGGLTTALSIDTKYSMCIFSKTVLHDGATYLAQGGVAAVVSSSDTVKEHVEDTLKAGDYHNDKSAVTKLSSDGGEAILWLQAQGVNFNKDSSGAFSTHLEGAHSQSRVVHSSDFTGKYIENALIKQCRAKKNISILENYFCADLIVENNRCFGAQFIHNNGIIVVKSDITVLSTGGLGQLYEWTTNPVVATGDGIALAHRAGVTICDLEFVQFHPTVLRVDESPLFLLSEALRGNGAHIINKNGERFLFDTLKTGELAPRDEISRAMYYEMKKNKVFLDMRHVKKEQIIKHFPNIYKTLLEKYGLDLSTDIIPITPAAHYSCGGVVTDLQGKTSLPNLYAVGEVACTGVHGANRLASNSLLEGVVFGRLAGKHISSVSRRLEPNLSSERSQQRFTGRDFSPDLIGIEMTKNKVKKIMWEKVGIIRSKKLLLEAQADINELQSLFLSECNFVVNQETLELQNMLTTSSLIIKAALARKKSLGAHYLIDHEQ